MTYLLTSSLYMQHVCTALIGVDPYSNVYGFKIILEKQPFIIRAQKTNCNSIGTPVTVL